MSSPNPEALLEHVGFLRAIALGLLRNEADAEDVVQQTLVAAMEKPPADDRNLKGWLGAVARNFALMQFRSRKRQKEREARVARAEGGPSTVEITARLEMEKRVVDAVAVLEEPFRTTLILRFYDGMTPKQIAAHLGIPDATVRTRLKRGLHRLRGDLEKRSGGRRPMLAGLLLLVQLPSQAASPWPARLVGASGAAAVIVAIVAVGWLVGEDRTEPGPERVEVVRAGETERVAAEPTRTVATISGRVVDQDRAVLARVEVIAIPHRGAGLLETPERRIAQWLARPTPVARTVTDRFGRYAIDLPPGRPVWIVARAEEYAIDAMPLLDVGGQYDAVDFLLRRDPGVGGEILDATGTPIEGVFVHGWESAIPPEQAPALCVARTGADGRFQLPLASTLGDDPARENRITLVIDARAKGYMPRLLRERRPGDWRIPLVRGPDGSLQTEPGTRAILLGKERFETCHSDANGLIEWTDSATEELTLYLLHPERQAVRLDRVPRGGLPRLPSAPLTAGRVEWPNAEVGLAMPRSWGDTAFFGFDCLRTVRADEEGRYRIRGEGRVVLAHRDAAPILFFDDGHASDASERFTGRAVDALGNPIAGARITAAPRTESPLWSGYVQRNLDLWTALTRIDGRFTIRHLPREWEKEYRIRARHLSRGLSNVSDHRDTTLRLERRLPTGRTAPQAPAKKSVVPRTLMGKVMHAGRGLPRAIVRVEGHPELSAVTGPLGHFEIPVRAPGKYTVLIRHPEHGSGRFEQTELNRWVYLPIPQWVSFDGRVTHQGRPVEDAAVRTFMLGRAFESTRTDREGRFRLMCTPYDKKFEMAVSHDLFMTSWIENPEEGDFELERASGVRIRIVDEQGLARSGVELIVDKHRRRSDRAGRVDLFRRTRAFEIALARTGQDWILAGPVEWSEDGALATVRIRRGLRIEGEVRDLQNQPLAHLLVLAEPVEKGSPVRRTFTNGEGRFVLRTLHPERYRLRVAGQEGSYEFAAGTTGIVLRKEKK